MQIKRPDMYRPKPYPGEYSLDHTAGFVDSCVQNGHGSHVGTTAQRKLFVISTLIPQQNFITKAGADRVRWNVNERLLKGTGGFYASYGDTDNRGNVTATTKDLHLVPTAAGDGIFNPMTKNAATPILSMGLFGDAREMVSGNRKYMRYLSVVLRDSDSAKDRRKAFNNAKKWRYRLAKVNPDLDIDQFSERKWRHIERRMNHVATRLLHEKLHENDPLHKLRRGTSAVLKVGGGLLAGAVVEKVVDRINPDLLPGIGNFLLQGLQHIPHP